MSIQCTEVLYAFKIDEVAKNILVQKSIPDRLDLHL
jgi:hypothetical protein